MEAVDAITSGDGEGIPLAVEFAPYRLYVPSGQTHKRVGRPI